MAGRPKRRRLLRDIEALAEHDEHAPGEPCSEDCVSGEDVVLSWIADGETMAKIGKRLDVSRFMIGDWIRWGGEERRRKVDLARQWAADAHVEDGLQGIEDSDPTLPADVTKATSRARYLQWMASKRNRAVYGDDAAAQVQVNVSLVADSHLAALRRYGNAARVVEAEEVKEISGGDGDAGDAGVEVAVLESRTGLPQLQAPSD